MLTHFLTSQAKHPNTSFFSFLASGQSEDPINFTFKIYQESTLTVCTFLPFLPPSPLLWIEFSVSTYSLIRVLVRRFLVLAWFTAVVRIVRQCLSPVGTTKRSTFKVGLPPQMIQPRKVSLSWAQLFEFQLISDVVKWTTKVSHCTQPKLNTAAYVALLKSKSCQALALLRTL